MLIYMGVEGRVFTTCKFFDMLSFLSLKLIHLKGFLKKAIGRFPRSKGAAEAI